MMKNVLVLLVILVFPAMSLGGGIVGSKHDFSGKIWSGGRICLPCHGSHNTSTDTRLDAPLWNREVVDVQYNSYSSDSLAVDIDPPSGVSKLCLSCHDGVTALDSYGGGGRWNVSITESSKLGNDPNSHHPISITYNSAITGSDGVLRLKEPSPGSGIEDLLWDNKVECTSCHDVHNDEGKLASLGYSTIQNLCLICHTSESLAQIEIAAGEGENPGN